MPLYLWAPVRPAGVVSSADILPQVHFSAVAVGKAAILQLLRNHNGFGAVTLARPILVKNRAVPTLTCLSVIGVLAPLVHARLHAVFDHAATPFLAGMET